MIKMTVCLSGRPHSGSVKAFCLTGQNCGRGGREGGWEEGKEREGDGELVRVGGRGEEEG